MQAFILAAGLGTRLKPLTDQRPKALVEVQGTPLLKLTIDKLAKSGISQIVVNVHHFGDMVIDYIQQNKWAVPVHISDERDLLLDTGGGLKHATHLFNTNEPILVHNVDILAHIDTNILLRQHTDSMSLATLVVSQRKTSRYLLFDQQNQLGGWCNTKTNEFKWTNKPLTNYQQLAFDGIALIQPELLDLLPSDDTPYPIIPSYLDIAKHHGINYFMLDKEDWLDVGKPETLAQAQQWKLF